MNNLISEETAAQEIDDLANQFSNDENLIHQKLNEIIALQKSMANSLGEEPIIEFDEGMTKNFPHNQLIPILEKLINVQNNSLSSLNDFKKNIIKMMEDQITLIKQLADNYLKKSYNNPDTKMTSSNYNTIQFGGNHAKDIHLQHFGVNSPAINESVEERVGKLTKSMAYELFEEIFDKNLAKEYQMQLTTLYHNNFTDFFKTLRTPIQQKILERI